jgi:Leucine-rich repeat (LRR) protein
LSGNELGDVGTALLTRWPGLVHVRSLDLSRNEIGDDGARALAQAASLGGLRQLWLNGNHISEAGKRTLSTAPHLRRAFVLQMQDNASPMPNIRR